MKNQSFLAKFYKNLTANFWKVSEDIFLKFSSKKHHTFGDIFVFFEGVIFITRKKKNI